MYIYILNFNNLKILLKSMYLYLLKVFISTYDTITQEVAGMIKEDCCIIAYC